MIEAMVARIGESNERVAEEYTRSFAVTRQLELERQTRYGKMVGSSAFMHELRKRIADWARRDEIVCIIGEKGVGKFHAACEIHHQSSGAGHPLLSIDGASFNQEEWLLKARAAQGGTLILEQADLLPADLLHRLIQSRHGMRLILTARSMPPVAKVHRLDLLPLRERAEDIPELVAFFLSEAGVLHPSEAISQEAMNMICAFPYLGGNIQELKRVVEDALVLSRGSIIRIAHLRFGSMRKPGTRPKIGLALGSGSARGAAHVGVLKVLEEEKIPIDLIAGTSVGAFIGALYAGGQPISAFERVLPTVRWRQLVQAAIPPKAIVNNSPMARFVEKYIGPVDFEDLAIPFAAMASDAVSGEAYILNKGRVSHAICASTAIPGIMKPVSYQNRMLVDGAVVHPVPVALAKSMGADIVIAVDLSSPVYTRKAPKHFISSILHTIEIMSEKIVQEELQLADVVLQPKLESQLSFKASPVYIREGEKAARPAVALIRKKVDTLMVHEQGISAPIVE
ncbi:hypothetical protein XYCOK13_01530 [Xylanibacillus composti]|uniref:NTE family protein n=2 Tax=Xylanibacillus composti TaxID=1572762 RepID=A0A8J4H1L7_9BACL|nr:patatin-like phospholipase family protein [Xylanibacillus composti]GIQ67329.1 hypothetical protein XYCOK13_01530 [Xylanibacillus composti]